MTRTLVLGYGNPLRGDDALGWEAAQRLEERYCGPDVTVITRHQLTPELAELFSQADVVILIDAENEGEFGRINVRRLNASSPFAPSNHFSDPSTLLSMASEWYGRRPIAYLVSTPGKSFDYCESITRELEELLPRFVDRVADLIEDCRSERAQSA